MMVDIDFSHAILGSYYHLDQYKYHLDQYENSTRGGQFRVLLPLFSR